VRAAKEVDVKKTVSELVLLVLLAGSFSLITLALAGEKEHEHLRKEHRIVRIGFSDLFPNPLEINASDAAMWVNLSHDDVEVIFEKDVVAHLHCKEPVRFHLANDGRLRSGWIGTLSTASLCSFDPGTYEYTVRGLAVGSPRAYRTTGKIIVKG
jgi:hypothetical protein